MRCVHFQVVDGGGGLQQEPIRQRQHKALLPCVCNRSCVNYASPCQVPPSDRCDNLQQQRHLWRRPPPEGAAGCRGRGRRGGRLCGGPRAHRLCAEHPVRMLCCLGQPQLWRPALLPASHAHRRTVQHMCTSCMHSIQHGMFAIYFGLYGTESMFLGLSSLLTWVVPNAWLLLPCFAALISRMACACVTHYSHGVLMPALLRLKPHFSQGQAREELHCSK